MELFSIRCTTCGAQLKVRHASAIGQILMCPKCQSMVQVEAPAGWTPPATSKPESKPAPEASGLQAGNTASKSKTKRSKTRPQPTAKSAAPPEPLPSPDPASAPEVAATVADPGTSAESMMPAQSAAQLDGKFEQAANSRWWEKWVLAGSVLVLLITLAIYFWPAGTDPQLAQQPDRVGTPADGKSSPATVRPKQPTSKQQTTLPPPAKTEPETESPPSVAEPVDPMPPAVEPEPKDPAPADPVVNPITPAPTTDPSQPTLPAARPDPTTEQPVKPRPELAPIEDVKPLLAVKLPALEFNDLPLSDVVEFLADVSTLRMTFDLEGLAEAGATTDDDISLRLTDTTVGDALRAALDQRRLDYDIQVGQLLITSAARLRGSRQSVRYPVEDLTRGNSQQLTELAKLVQTFVDPGGWGAEQGTRLETEGGFLTVHHHASMQRRTAELLDKLRLARGALGDAGAGPNGYRLDSRLAQLRKKLDKSLTVNYPDTPLGRVLEHLQNRTEFNIATDWIELASVGLAPETKVDLRTVRAESLASLLDRLLRPLGLAFRAIDGKTLLITTATAAAAEYDLEVYPIRDLAVDDTSGQALAGRIASEVEPQSWHSGGGAGRLQYDPQAKALVVLQIQSIQGQVEDLLETIRTPTDKNVQPPKAAANPDASVTK